MSNGFTLNHDKNLQILPFLCKVPSKNDFLKDVENTVDGNCHSVHRNTGTHLYLPKHKLLILSVQVQI